MAAIAEKRLIKLTAEWNTYEDVPKDEQQECRQLGEALNRLGGIETMRGAYYAATAKNRAAKIIAAYWDGIGDWRW